MSDTNIIIAARKAQDVGDFSDVKRVAKVVLASAKRRWFYHEEQDQRCKNYHALPLWKKIFKTRSFDGALPGRARAADDLMFAEALYVAVAKRNVERFTDRRS